MKMLLVMGRQSRCFHILSGNVSMMMVLCQVSKKLNFLGVRISISRIFSFNLYIGFFLTWVFLTFFVDCAIDLDVMSNEDLDKVASGEMVDDKKEELLVKTTLEFVNLFTSMYSIRKEATESALRFLFTNAKDNNIQGIGLKRKSKFEIIDDGVSSSEDVVKHERVESIVVNKKCSKVDNIVMSESTIVEYEFSEVEHLINSRTYEPRNQVTLSRSNGSCNPPNSRRILCHWFK